VNVADGDESASVEVQLGHRLRDVDLTLLRAGLVGVGLLGEFAPGPRDAAAAKATRLDRGLFDRGFRLLASPPPLERPRRSEKPRPPAGKPPRNPPREKENDIGVSGIDAVKSRASVVLSKRHPTSYFCFV
jgi:hypothetical protein